ncbi:DUF3450 domain-containing protein [Arundinibacter roseus]|uniref:Uncharacterized protein n=1 Tax=Arundinibacter roseus TaxID=2070510 RepID=A0A4R4K8X9_9BACT|nr:hypothetical protein [Arundinibacter roseus]TDB64217.1 hypothetical protein EZE20_14890 [Arundinibacter roseus]
MKSLITLTILFLSVTSGYCQFSLPFFKDEYKELYETEVQTTSKLTQHNSRLSLNVRVLNDSLYRLNKINSQLQVRIGQLENYKKKLEDRIFVYARETKRMEKNIQSLTADTTRLHQELADLTEQITQVERQGLQRSALFEKQLFVLRDSLSINSNLYKRTSDELFKIQTIFSFVKLGDMEFDIPADQFINSIHSAVLTGNSKLLLRKSANGEAILVFNTDVKRRRFIGSKMTPYSLEAYIRFWAHPLQAEDKTITSIRTKAFNTDEKDGMDSINFNELELVKSRFYRELERINYSFDSSTIAQSNLSSLE